MGPKKEKKEKDDVDEGPRKSKAAIAKAEAVAAMKAQMNQGLSAFELDKDEDVYDLVDEKEYASVVEARRNKGDFVVDDGKSCDFQERNSGRFRPAPALSNLFPSSSSLPHPTCLNRWSWLRRRRRGDPWYSRGPHGCQEARASRSRQL